MKLPAFLFIILLVLTIALSAWLSRLGKSSLSLGSNNVNAKKNLSHPATVGEIPLPYGFARVDAEQGSFAEWLRNLHLRKDNIVYLYNGKPIDRQDLHYAVLDISTGNKDLQQCADAIMRLKAEYYFSKKQFEKIAFPAGRGSEYNFLNYANQKRQCFTHECLMQFMENVFIYCGTYTLDEMTRPVDMHQMQIGDVFVKAGAPGHAMIVADVATDEKTKQKIYLLAQGYMPAQDMHIVINPNNSALNPWYKAGDSEKIITPGWVFDKRQLKRWK